MIQFSEYLLGDNLVKWSTDTWLDSWQWLGHWIAV